MFKPWKIEGRWWRRMRGSQKFIIHVLITKRERLYYPWFYCRSCMICHKAPQVKWDLESDNKILLKNYWTHHWTKTLNLDNLYLFIWFYKFPSWSLPSSLQTSSYMYSTYSHLFCAFLISSLSSPHFASSISHLCSTCFPLPLTFTVTSLQLHLHFLACHLHPLNQHPSLINHPNLN